MKIVAILESDVASGGAFNQTLNAILQMREICLGRYDFEVLTTISGNIAALEALGLAAERFSYSIADKIPSYLSLSPWWHRLQAQLRFVGPFERNLLRRGCDLVYFVTPSVRPSILQRLSYITTVWDLCHRDSPEFPEAREFAEFQAREHFYRTTLPAAFAIIVDSARLAASITHRYGIDIDRLLTIPFAPAPHLSKAASNRPSPEVLASHGLQPGYFFYPAQIWAHKNHVRILEALAVLAQTGERPAVVFCGGDKHNLRHVEAVASRLGVQAQVRSLGFVPPEDVRGLYEGCAAVLMPTYFGPTNLPPLEAWLLSKPLVYSTHCTEQAGDAAICVDPDNAKDLANAMRRVLDPAVAAELVERGKRRLKQIEAERLDGQGVLLRRLQQFESRRRCWE